MAPGLLVALAWALLDSPRGPGAVRLMGWYPTCSPSPVTLGAVSCVTSVCGESGTKDFQRVAGTASTPGETVLDTCLHPAGIQRGRKRAPLPVLSSSVSPDLSLAASGLVAAATFLVPRERLS